MGVEERRDTDASEGRRKRKATADEIEIDVSANEPPSKKALRKEKKKSALKPHGSSQTHPDNGSRDPAPARDLSQGHQTAQKSPYGVWMGNIPYTANKEDIKKFLVDHSSVTSEKITRIHIPSSRDQPSTPRPPRPELKSRNKGFAYVDLSTEIALQAVLSLSERLISGRRVLIKDAKNFEGRPEKPVSGVATGVGVADAKPPTNRIFIGNLSFDTTKEDLQEHFARCGEVSDVHVATFEDSGKCKGYAWVTFNETRSATVAVQGWAKIPIEEGEESDPESQDKDDTADGTHPPKQAKKLKIEKFFFNRIKGRPLRMEFAEDKAVRYQKRFGKDGTAKKLQEDSTNASAEPDGDSIEKGLPVERKHIKSRRGFESSKALSSVPVKTGRASIEVSRLTGGIVEGQGKKTSFA